MTEYRYFTTQTLNGSTLGDLPLYGVSMDRRMSAAGNFTGTFRLDMTGYDNETLIDITKPMHASIWCERDGEVIWGGIIWSRTYESNAKTIQLNAQTFESYLGKVIIDENLLYNQNQLKTAVDLINHMQALRPQPIIWRQNIRINTTLANISGGTSRILAAYASDYKYYLDAINELADGEVGFDWTINLRPSPLHPLEIAEKYLALGQPQLIPYSATAPFGAYDYPGNIKQFYWPEGGAAAGTRFLGLGAGSGSKMLTSKYISPVINEGYPIVDQVLSRKDIMNQSSLDQTTRQFGTINHALIIDPSITIYSARGTGFTAWNGLGGYCQIMLDSPLWPEPQQFIRRMMGWELSPATGESEEEVKLILDGEDDAAE